MHDTRIYKAVHELRVYNLKKQNKNVKKKTKQVTYLINRSNSKA